MTVAIVDDLNKDIETLEKNIEKYCQEHKIHLKVQQFTSEASFLLSLYWFDRLRQVASFILVKA